MRRSNRRLPALLALFLLAAAGCVGELPEIPEEGSLEDRVGVLESRVEALEEENAELRREIRASHKTAQGQASEPPTSMVSRPTPLPAEAPEPESEPEPDHDDQEASAADGSRWAVEVLEVTSRVTEANESWMRFAWRLTAKSRVDRPVFFEAEIKFFDQDGYIVDTDSAYDLELQPGESRTFTGDTLIRMPGADSVTGVGANLSL